MSKLRGFRRGISPPRRRAGFRPAGRVPFPRGKGTKRRWGTPQRRTSFAMSACPQTPALRGRQLGRMVRYRKGAGGSVERPPLVFRWRWPGCNRKPELPWLRAPLLRRGSSCAEGNGGYGSRCVFLVGPDALIGPFPGGPVCRPYSMCRGVLPFCRGRSQTGPPTTDRPPPARQSQARD